MLSSLGVKEVGMVVVTSGVEVSHSDRFRASNSCARPNAVDKSFGRPTNTFALIPSFKPLIKQLTW